MNALSNIEFFTDPKGAVNYKKDADPIQTLAPGNREIISPMINIIKSRFPHAYSRLTSIYAKRSANILFYEYSIVSRFVRCNFGHFDYLSTDVDINGNFSFEHVSCPLRGECHHENVICCPDASSCLTKREMEVFRLTVVNKLQNAEIAAVLNISPFTVKNHRDSIREKISAKNVADMVDYWKTNNLK